MAQLRPSASEKSMLMAGGMPSPLDSDLQSQLAGVDSAREAQLLESWKAYKKNFQEGLSLFNKKPKKGIQFMQVGI